MFCCLRGDRLGPLQAKAVDSRPREGQNSEPMISVFFVAILKAGLPVGIAAYLLVWWALRNGRLGSAGTLGEVEKELKSQTKDKERKKQADLVHRKWLTMGGGFYGVVAVLTLLWIELWEIIDFITGFEGFGTLAGLFSINTLINLFSETLMNTLSALVWPLYWLGSTQGAGWIWILAAYAGYWAGRNLALRQHLGARQNHSS